jgi:hypothetical protein
MMVQPKLVRMKDAPPFLTNHQVAKAYHTTPEDVRENWPLADVRDAVMLMKAEARAERELRNRNK